MRVVVASNNKGKISEMRMLLASGGFEVMGLADVGFTDDIEETGDTFEANALTKAETVSKACGLAAIADDSGLVVDALDGAPGVYSARYGGDECRGDVERYQLLLKNMEGIEDRSARFVSSIVCVFPDGETISARGECEGEITFSPAGSGGFGYDPIFFIPEMGRTMAGITPEEKNKISHRAKAMAAFIDKFIEKHPVLDKEK